MSDITNLQLGRKGKEGNINVTELKGGIKKENIDSQFANIFDTYDTDGNTVLTDNEVAQLKSDVLKYAEGGNDSIFSQKEANKLSKEKGIQDSKGTVLFDFLKSIEANAKSIISSESIDSNTVQTKFVNEDGNEVTETYDKNTQIATQVYQKDGKTIKTLLKNGLKQQETITDETTGNIETITYNSDGQTIKQKVLQEKSPAKTTTTDYEGGKPSKETVVTDTSEENYIYDANGEKKITKKIENKTDATKHKTTTYTYNSDGSHSEVINDYTGTVTINYDSSNNETKRITEKNGKTTILEKKDDGYSETITESNSTTENKLNNDQQRLTSTKKVNDKEYSLNYDGEGNITGVVVQFNENISSIAKKFGCTVDELLEANKDIVKTNKSGRKYFAVGQEIKIPDKNYKLEADNKVFQNRKDAEGAKAEYREYQAKIQAQRKKEDDELAGRKGHARQFLEQKHNTFDELAKSLYQREGITNPTKRQLELRINELKQLNPSLQDGQLIGNKVIATFNAETDASIGAGQQQREVKRKQAADKKEQQTGKTLASSMYKAMDDHIAGVGEESFQNALSKVNSKNVVGLLKEYKKMSPDETLIESIMDETGSMLKTRRDAIGKIVDALIQRADNAGISDERQKQAVTACKNELKSYWSLGIGYCSTSKLDGLINNLVGAIDAAEALTHEEKAKMKGSGINETLELMGTQVSENETALNNQLDNDGWCGDLYEGLKWCVGSDNLDENVKAKLEEYKSYIGELEKAEKSGGEAGFKAKFKEIFGVEYDANLIKGYSKLQNNYAMAQGLNLEINGFKNEFGKALEGKDYYVDTRRNYAKYLEANSNGQITDSLKATDSAIAIQLKKQGIDFNKATESQKADALRQIIKNTYNEMNTKLNSYTNGRSLSQMEEQLNNAGSAVFGNKHDIAFAVNDYISSQKEGGAAVNMAAKTVAAITIAVATGGTGLAALGTAAVLTTAVSASIDLSDRMSSKVGLQDGEVETILKNATVDGACVFAGGMVGKFASVFKSANSFVQAGGRLTMQLAGDAATGAAAEYVQTGSITLEGVTFNAVFSAAGNILSLRQAGRNVKQTTATEVTTKTPSPRATVKPKAKYPEDTVLGRISKNETPRSVGKLSDTNYASLKTDIETRLKTVTSETELDALKKEIEKLEVRDQRRPLEQLIEAKRTELKTGSSTPKTEEVETDSNSGQTTKAETSETTGKKQVINHDVDAALKKAPENIKQAYRKLSQEIENLTVETYTTIKNNIRMTLNNAKELMNDLLDKLEAKYKSIKSTVTGKVEIESPKIGEKLPSELRAKLSAESELTVRNLKSGERTIEKIGDKHYIIKNDNGELKLEGIIDNSEFTRVAGNEGKAIDERYIQNSLEAKNKILEAIDSGEYTASVESYMKTMNEAHKLSYEGKNGTNKYYQKNNELLEMEGGKPRTDQRGMISDYVEKAEEVEQIAKKYGDSYSTQNNSKVKLKGIPDSDLPLNSGTQHNYPKGQSLHSYYTQMQRTAKEALELINSGAPKEKILKKIAEHYQYAANARPYQQINNSLYMNEINTLLQKAGLNTMPHGIMDHVAMRLQPDKFEKYFIDQYYATSIQTN